MKFTVFGASGFIGSNLTLYLRDTGKECFTPERDDQGILEENLGHVIYCVGLTADFRGRPFDTVKAHVCHLLQVLEGARFESFLYLSSTRVYAKSNTGAEETPLVVDSTDNNDLYNLSKMMGESLCFSMDRATVRVARLSNVYGYDFASDNFLTSIVRDAVDKKKVVLTTKLESVKDYIYVGDVVRILPEIARRGVHQLYNLASGQNVSHEALLQELQRLTSCSVEVDNKAELVMYPRISIERLTQEFNFAPSSVLVSMADLVDQYQFKEACNDKD